MQKPKITYFLGAGASYGTIPILDEMPAKMQLQINNLKGLSIGGYYKDIDRQSILNEYIENLNWLMEHSKSHNTIDTLAKKLFLNNDYRQLNILKSTVSLFFTIYQFHDGTNKSNKKAPQIHQRYISLISAFLEKNENGVELPDNVSFISWNYDYQLELALQNFNAKFRYYPNLDSSFKNGNHIIHLNGIAGLYSTGHNLQLIFDDIRSSKLSTLLEEILPIYYEGIRKTNTNFDFNRSLTYAWEKNDLANNSHIMAGNILRETDYLIIIGYSFPVFNREYDRALLKNLGEKVKKIYYQDPSPDLQALALTFNLDQGKIHEIRKVDQFFLPFEF